jgi:hypothetical protein
MDKFVRSMQYCFDWDKVVLHLCVSIFLCIAESLHVVSIWHDAYHCMDGMARMIRAISSMKHVE